MELPTQIQKGEAIEGTSLAILEYRLAVNNIEKLDRRIGLGSNCIPKMHHEVHWKSKKFKNHQYIQSSFIA